MTTDPNRDVATRLRLGVSFAVGIAAAVVTGLVGQWKYAPLVGWDVAVLVYTGWVWLAIAGMSNTQTEAHATREDPGRTQSDIIVLVASVASLVAVGVVLVSAGSASGAREAWLAGLGVASVALSWTAVHTLFTLRYARLYYLGQPGGIDFNQQQAPGYLEFAYLAFTVGMTFQVSDTNLKTTAIRATALRQALLSYLFGAVILATTINLVASLGTKS